MGTSVGASLALGEAVQLAHALVATVCEGTDVPYVAIKGPSSSHHRLREERTSADVDVLVRESDATRLLGLLERMGWHQRPKSELAAAADDHSITLIHDAWPCDVDVHTAFPGFLAPGDVVFAEVWRRHVTLDLAGVPVNFPDRSSSILVSALHALRSPTQTARHAAEFATLRDIVLPALDQDELEDLVTLAVATQCADTARPVFANVRSGLPPELAFGVDRRLDDWRTRTYAGASQTSKLWIAVRRAPKRTAIPLLIRAVWPTEDQFRIDHPDVLMGRDALMRARLARIGRGLRAVPGLVKGSAAARRGTTASTEFDP